MALKLSLSGGEKQLKEEIMWLKVPCFYQMLFKKNFTLLAKRRIDSLTDGIILWIYKQRLSGAKHIVRMLASCESLRVSEKGGKYSVIRINPNQGVQTHFDTVFDSLAGMMGPMVALEYLDRGDLLALIGRVKDRNKRLPNRVLWSIFLCSRSNQISLHMSLISIFHEYPDTKKTLLQVVRACIGLAYPIGGPPNGPSVFEVIPEGGRLVKPPANITNSDITLRNMMLATGDELEEHQVGQMVKMIDLGLITEVKGGERGPLSNIFGISSVSTRNFESHHMTPSPCKTPFSNFLMLIK